MTDRFGWRRPVGEPAPAQRRKGPGWRTWALLVGAVAIVLGGLGTWRASAARGTAAPQGPTGTVSRGNLDITVQGSGTVQPARSIDLPFQAQGQVKDVLAKAGDQVKTGQALAHLDTRDLQLQVQQAEANLKTAQAKLDQAKNGAATPEDLRQGQAQIQSAEAAVSKAKTGNVTPADIKNAQAGVAAAQDRLRQTVQGNVTPADIASAQAAVRNAQAGLQRVKSSVTAADIAAAQSQVKIAQANLQKAKTGNVTAADIASAQAAVASAQAKLDAAKAGPAPDEVSAAQAKLKQAQQNLQKVSATASASKTNAAQSVAQAADNVRLAQSAYTTAYWNNQNAQAGIDPKTNKSFSSEKQDPAPARAQYAAALHDAQVQLDQAQSKLEQAKVAQAQSQQQEVTDIATAQSQVDDAQVQLNTLLQGPKQTDLIPLQSAVDQAKAQLSKLQSGGTPADIAAAQGQLDQAKANLTKLTQGPSAADLAAAQAQIDQAKANLAKLTQGGSASDVKIAQDAVAQAKAQLDKAKQGGTPADVQAAQSQLEQTKAEVAKLTAPAAEPDVAAAEAGVAQAGAALETAKLNLDRGTLFAPFDGTLRAVNIVPGSIVSASAAAMAIDDRSSLHIDLSMSESDVGRVQTNQPVKLTFDALPGATLAGKVTSIATNATVQQNVVTYLVQISFDPGATPIKLGMTANASITVQQIKDAVLVPSRAIQTQGSNRTVQVLYGVGQAPVSVAVETGATNGQQTEITGCSDTGNQCLREGDRLVLNTPTTQTRTGGGGPGGGGAHAPSLLGGGR